MSSFAWARLPTVRANTASRVVVKGSPTRARQSIGRTRRGRGPLKSLACGREVSS